MSDRRKRAAGLRLHPRDCLRLPWAGCGLCLLLSLAAPVVLSSQQASGTRYSSLYSLSLAPPDFGTPMRESHSGLPEAFLHPDFRCAVAASAVDFTLRTDSPNSGGDCVHLAEVLDSADLRGAALNAWQRVLTFDPSSERAHARVAQLLLEAGDVRGAEVAATHGLEIVPKSASLRLIASEAMEREGREYDARRILLEASGAAGDELLGRLVTMQDAHGEGAAEIYARLADSPLLGPDKRLAALERGFEVALRDEDMAQARRVAGLLDAEGHPEFERVTLEEPSYTSVAMIPGGRDALAFIALAKAGNSEQKFLAEFSRALLANVCTGVCFGEDEYKKTLETYFTTVSQLEALGTRDHDRVSITIARGNPDDNRRTEKVLGLLGVDLRTENGVSRLQQGVKPRQVKKQDLVSALDIDLIGMEKALQAGKPYMLEIRDEPVEIYPNARVWKDAFPGRFDEGFAQMLVRHPQVARLYASVSEIDAHTLETLFGGVSPAEFTTRYADELARFGPAFAVNGSSAVVPGGPRAASVWKELVGVSPDQPGLFFRALLSNPPLLAFFYAVSELDGAHQAFFTANPRRALRFYTLSKGLTEERDYHKNLAMDSTFSRFLRSVPLDENGHVNFPGSARVWMVAKGAHSDERHISVLEKRASATAAPAMEEAILSHLAETRYDAQGFTRSELDNFLAVSRLNAHLKEPMDEESALLLAQNYSECWPLYVYFSDLPGVNNIGLKNYFSILDQIRQKPKLIQNLEMGQLYSLLAWVSILGRNLTIPQEKVASLFSQVGEAMQSAVGQGQAAVTSLDLARSIVNACGSSGDENLDEGIRHCMLRGWSHSDAGRADDFDRVLALQKAPSLADLQSMAAAAQRILSALQAEHSHRDAVPEALRADAQQILEAAAHLPIVEIPRIRRIPSREREAIDLYRPEAIREQARQLNDILGGGHPDFKAARKAADELLAALRPQVTAALAAPVYAYYLRSTDLIVSEDPLLLRKHRYVDYVVPLGGRQVVERAEFTPSSDGVGSHFVGGFGNFALIAGHAAAAGFHRGSKGAEGMLAAEIAAIRSVPWDRLREADQRLATLRILAGREWIVRSASDPHYLEALEAATLGVLALGRRADLLNSIADRDWNSVWKSVPLPDLYTLGSEISRYSLPRADSSPVLTELRALESSGRARNIDYLGHIPYLADGCGHLHMAVDAPYEEYARRLMEEDLAERTADFKLYLAVRADHAGVEPSELGRVAEKLAARAFAASQLIDYHDWRSLFAAYSSISTQDLKRALEP
jgi:hypothetical protein